MLGYLAPGNDLYIFFEKKEIELLENKILRGKFFNLGKTPSMIPLEVSIDSEINSLITAKGERKAKNGEFTKYSVRMIPQVYSTLNKIGIYSLYQGFMHINLLDSKNGISLIDKNNYYKLLEFKKDILKNNKEGKED